MVEFYILGEATLKLDVVDTLAAFALISRIQTSKLLSKGAQEYLISLVTILGDKVN